MPFRIAKELLILSKRYIGLIKLRIIALNFFKSLDPGLLETKSRMKFAVFSFCIHAVASFPRDTGDPGFVLFKVKFFNLRTTDFLDLIILCWGGVVVPWTMGYSAASLACTCQMPGATSPQVLMTRNVSRHCQMSSRSQNHPWSRTSDCRLLHS